MTTHDNLDDSAAPLIEHLTELRTRLIRSVIAFVIAMVICFAFWNPVFNFLTQPLCQALAERGQEECGLVLIALQEGFFVAVSISMLGGLVFSFPVISYQMWRFVAPGLYREEKQAFLPFLIASPVMFFLGASFAYFVITPMAFDFFLGFQQGSVMEDTEGSTQAAGILFQGSAQAYLKLTIKFIIAFGLCFQLPVLLTLMGKAGLVGADGLRTMRKYAVVGILVLAALATPPDVVSQVMLFVVVYGLYEVSIQLVARVEKKREEQLRAEGYYDDEFGDAADEDSDAEADEKPNQEPAGASPVEPADGSDKG